MSSRIETGSWENAGQAAVDGASSGFLSGSISGAVTGAITSGISGACFVAGTPVLTEDGLIPIEAIAAGMLVLAEDPETGEKGLRQVVRKFVRETDELTHVTISGKNGNTETIDCTPEHPFYVEGQGWICAGSLHKGMKVRFSNGAEGTIKDILCEELAKPTPVYNFEVEDLHTYYVGDSSVLVHNACDGSYKSPVGGGGITDTIYKNGRKIVFGHGGRHLASSGLDINHVNNVLAESVSKLGLHEGEFHKGIVTIMGFAIEYTSYGLSDTVTKIGTYYIK